MKTEKPEEKKQRDLNLEKDRKFPESSMSKDQRKDADSKDDADLETLKDDVAETRATSRNTHSFIVR